jgi:hypothetical protein
VSDNLQKAELSTENYSDMPKLCVFRTPEEVIARSSMWSFLREREVIVISGYDTVVLRTRIGMDPLSEDNDTFWIDKKPSLESCKDARFIVAQDEESNNFLKNDFQKVNTLYTGTLSLINKLGLVVCGTCLGDSYRVSYGDWCIDGVCTKCGTFYGDLYSG